MNGQKIFIKGGNWICSDEMLRCSKERYDAEVRYHHDMNLNLIRVWGGGLTERPEFYDACDKYGMLVMQDFWLSGDCNGRWADPLKRQDTTARRNYPDDHKLLLTTMADQVLMLRNHPSLAFWCGGNEIRPPADVLKPLGDSILPLLDGTRFFFEYSNDDSMSYHAYDGPYTIQPDTFFWQHRSYGFNSEIGSIGIGDYESLQRFIPAKNMLLPYYDTGAHKWIADSVWQYHKYSSYDSAIEAYGHPKDIADFAKKAQLVNYNQYRALVEGASAHMWDWYTGIIEWKTQNPWTAMVGQMYDVYLDPNACMFGIQEGAKPLHIMYDPVKRSVLAVSNRFDSLRAYVFGGIYNNAGYTQIAGKTEWMAPQSCKHISWADNTFNALIDGKANRGGFLVLCMIDSTTGASDQNIYTLPDLHGTYTWLAALPEATAIVSAGYKNDSMVAVTIDNKTGNTISFLNRVSLVDKTIKGRILPVFCNINYISVIPGELKTVTISFSPQKGINPIACIEGWNTEKKYIEIKR